MKTGAKIFLAILGAAATYGIVLILTKYNSKSGSKSEFSGCDGLSGNESTNSMCNHLHSEHESAEKELRKILELAKQKKHDICKSNIINAWDGEINHHFNEEEKVVFPKMIKNNKSLSPIINDLLNDHKVFYRMIDEIKNNKNCNKEIIINFCNKLLNHIEKEESLFLKAK